MLCKTLVGLYDIIDWFQSIQEKMSGTDQFTIPITSLDLISSSAVEDIFLSTRGQDIYKNACSIFIDNQYLVSEHQLRMLSMLCDNDYNLQQEILR